jgi:hypothetical protein
VIKWIVINQNDEEIALYDDNIVSRNTLIKDYIQYGSGNHQRASSAVTS